MYLFRAFAVWLIIRAAESAHGTLRELFFAPVVGDFRARLRGLKAGGVAGAGPDLAARHI